MPKLGFVVCNDFTNRFLRETYDRQKADVKTKQTELQNMEESLTQKVIAITRIDQSGDLPLLTKV